MKNIIYTVHFNITNLDKSELRELKIDTLVSNNCLDFESIDIPRIPSPQENITIAGRKFKVTESSSEWIIKEDAIYNAFTVSIVDVEKQAKVAADLIKMKAEAMAKMTKKASEYDWKDIVESKYGNWNTQISDNDWDELYRIIGSGNGKSLKFGIPDNDGIDPSLDSL